MLVRVFAISAGVFAISAGQAGCQSDNFPFRNYAMPFCNSQQNFLLTTKLKKKENV